MTSHPSSDGNFNKFIPGLRAVLPVLLVLAAVVMPGERANAQNVQSFTCNQANNDSIQVCWSIGGTNCSFPFNYDGATIRMNGSIVTQTTQPSSCITIPNLFPGGYSFSIDVEGCTGGISDSAVCNRFLPCTNPIVSCSTPAINQALITLMYTSTFPQIEITMDPPGGGTVTVYSGPPIPAHLVTGLPAGVYGFSFAPVPIFDCPPSGVACTVQVNGTEICNNGIDDDGDGLIDCADPDCAADPACSAGPCSGGPPGSPCDDGDPCTVADVCDGTGTCNGTFLDTDSDGVCDAFDICPGGDDSLDSDVDGVPDFCDCDPLDGTVFPGATEICGNGIDNDCDGSIDCADPDCATDPACTGGGPCSGAPAGSPCDDGDPCTINDVCDGMGGCAGEFIDVDGDGFSTACGDCNDNNDAMYPGAVEICNDNFDNDCDGGIDCSDPDDCATDPACTGGGPCSGAPAGSPCDDGDPCTINDVCDGMGGCAGEFIDVDGDGFSTACGDCNDNNDAMYPGAVEICNDNFDNDCDGGIDCSDPDDCATDPSCTGGGPCTSHIDCDDGDPCTADECIGGTCVYTPIAGCGSSELCNNGIDDDGDMLVDCDDPDCFTDPACQVGTCSITNISVGCDAANGPDGYTISFDVVNDTPFDVTHIFVPGSVPGIPGSALSPTVTSFSPPLLPGTSGTVLLSLSGGSPFLMACFPVGLMAIDDATGNLFQCCATEVCTELPPCEACLDISAEGGAWGAAAFGYDFTLTNLAGTDPAVATYAYLVPTTPGVSVDNNWFDLGGLSDGFSTALSTNISGAVPLQEVCFLVTIHDATLGECCGFVHCFTLPPLLLPPAVQFLRGDANADGSFDVSDVVTSLDFIFQGESVYCVQALDSNDDESVNIADAVFSLAALFAGGAEPAPPGTVCGLDETTGTLGCEVFPACDEDNSGSPGG